MATRKPISTISYNTHSFLREKLDLWVSKHIIQSYMYIFHKGEDGDKDHFHVRLEPNKTLDPMELKDQLMEFTPSHPKPLGCRPFRPSSEEDWVLYVVHDPDYMKLKYSNLDKGEKLPYSWTDICAPEDYDVEIAFIRAKAALKHSSVSLASRLQQGESAMKLVLQGENIHTVNALMRAISISDYDRLQKKHAETSARLSSLVHLLHTMSLSVSFDSENNAFLDSL